MNSGNVSRNPNLPLNDRSVATCCANNLEIFSVRQASLLGKFAEVISNTQSQNINRISTEIGKQFQN